MPLILDRGSTRVSSQMLLVDWQSLELAGLLTLGLDRTVGWGRPLLDRCEEASCSAKNRGNHVSFASGHASMAFAGAGLTCAHHQALGLYGAAAAGAGIAVAGIL